MAFSAILATTVSNADLLAAETARQPDIVLIMADDMGFSDIGCYGSEIETPNLDRLAGGGLRYTQFYNGARCCPTRAALLTGLYAHQAGMGCMEPDWGLPGYRGRLNRNCVTLAEALKLTGYSTYMAGKWHVTNQTRARTPAEKETWPRQRGFDRFFGTIAGAGSFFTPHTLTRDNENIDAEAKDDPAFYYTDAISDNAAGFIADHAKTQADAPLFLYVAYTAPHWPLHAKQSDIEKYEGKYSVGWDEIRSQRYARMIELGIIDRRWPLSPRDNRVPAWKDLEDVELPTNVSAALKEDSRTISQIMAHKMAVYAAMIDCMDQGIGRIVAALQESGRLDNTLILFLADNGGCDEWGVYGFGWERLLKNGEPSGTPESSTSYGPSWANPSNTPFRFYKHFAHEGGISTPLIAHWPAGIKARGELRAQVAHIIDVMPTLLDVGGGEYPPTYQGNKIKPLAGVSLLPTFRDDTLDREAIFWEHHGNRAVRAGKWKLVANGETGPWELYDIEADRTELHDLAAQEPERVEQLAAMWTAWAEQSDVLPMNPNRKPGFQKPKK